MNNTVKAVLFIGLGLSAWLATDKIFKAISPLDNADAKEAQTDPVQALDLLPQDSEVETTSTKPADPILPEPTPTLPANTATASGNNGKPATANQDEPLGTPQIKLARQLQAAKRYKELVYFIRKNNFWSFDEEARRLNEEAVLLLAEAECKEKNYSTAIAYLQYFLDQYPNHVPVLERMADVYLYMFNANMRKHLNMHANIQQRKMENKSGTGGHIERSIPRRSRELPLAIKAFELLDLANLVSSEMAQANDMKAKSLNKIAETIKFLRDNKCWYDIIEFTQVVSRRGGEDLPFYQFEEAVAHMYLTNKSDAIALFTALSYDERFGNKSREYLSMLQNPEETAPVEPPAVVDAEGARPQPLPGEIQVPVLIRDGSIHVPVKFNGSTSALLLLDTGATMVHISTRLRNALVVRTTLEPRWFSTAGGKVQSPIVMLDSLNAGTAQVKNIESAVSDIFDADSGLDGILGMNFLGFYDFSIDQKNALMTLKLKKSNP